VKPDAESRNPSSADASRAKAVAASVSAEGDGGARFVMLCRRCERPLNVRREWVGRDVKCPHCDSVLRVPEPPSEGRVVTARAPYLAPKRCFNFPCPRCECLLEGHTGMCGQPGTCPTCGSRFVVPHLGPGRQPDRAVLLEGEVADPTPLHAYAAAGREAPQIVQSGGQTWIQCPRCNARSPIDADDCAACGAPFTMEGAATMGLWRQQRHGSTAVMLGVISVFTFMFFVPALAAVWFGAWSTFTPSAPGRSKAGITGLVLGLVSLIGGLAFWAGVL